MPLYCSTTGSTALRDAEVQQPMMAATLSLTSSFLAFSAKVGQSLAPSSWMNLILRPRTPPAALICFDGELLGFDRTGFRNRHRAGGRVQDTDRHFSIGYRETWGVDR